MLKHGDSQPYEVRFKRSPRARTEERWVRYGRNAEEVHETTLEAVKREYPKHGPLVVVVAGVDAEAMVEGVLRGGRVYRDRFYFHSPRLRSVPVVETDSLKFFDEKVEPIY